MVSLVDSSVWITFFAGEASSLDQLLEEGEACLSEIILMELQPFLHIHRDQKIIDLLETVKRVPMRVDWAELRMIRIEILQNGINKVGIPDLIILQQALQNNLPICSFDKQFKLMKEIFDFELIEG